MPTIEPWCLSCCAALKRFWRLQRSNCCSRSMSRRLWIGFEMTVMSTPPILAASSAFSIVVGDGLWRAPMFLWNCVPVKAAMSSGGRTCTWKSMIMGSLVAIGLAQDAYHSRSCPRKRAASRRRMTGRARPLRARDYWMPAFAGMTRGGSARRRDDRLLVEVLPLLRLVEHLRRVDELQRALGEGR